MDFAEMDLSKLDFDWEYYLELYPDLVAKNINTKKNALHHYLSYGRSENRLININQVECNENIVEKIKNVEPKINTIIDYKTKISIVMTNLNRKTQLVQTLKSFKQYLKKYNFEIIIVDDGSDVSIEDIKDRFLTLDIKIISISKKDKKGVNGTIAYNIGFKHATGDIIVIQNSEVLHVENVLGNVLKYISNENYLVFSVFNSPNYEYNDLLYDKIMNKSNNIYEDFIQKINYNDFDFNYHFYINKYDDCKNMSYNEALKHWYEIGMNEYRECNENGTWYEKKAIKKWKGWLSHPEYNQRCFHFLTAVTRENLMKIRGFDENLCNNLTHDDDDFIIRMSNVVNEINIVDPKLCFGIHQYHVDLTKKYEKVFDFNKYLKGSKDLEKARLCDHKKLWWHFLNHGYKEHRQNGFPNEEILNECIKFIKIRNGEYDCYKRTSTLSNKKSTSKKQTTSEILTYNKEIFANIENGSVKKNSSLENNNDKKISIVMAYYNNRKEQTITTLDGFEQNYAGKYDFEVIIVDDNSDEEFKLHNIVSKYSFSINLIVISKEEKGTRINPCSAYNKGFKHAKGEIIIIQNPECYHAGDIIGYTVKNLNEMDYFTYSCYSANNFEITKQLLENKYPYELIKNKEFNNKNSNIIGLSWYNHPTEPNRNTYYHFCSAIYKSKLDLIGGFDERFSEGYCFDDDEFLLSIKYNLRLNLKIIDPNDVFVIHQFHERNMAFNIDKEPDTNSIKQKWLKNKHLYEEMKNYHERNTFNYPKLLHLYWDGSPLSFLNFITVLSFNKHNKFWKINLFMPSEKTEKITWKDDEQKIKYSETCYLNNVKNIENVLVHYVNFDNIEFDNNISEVIKSDYFRYYILQKHGGLWSDFDIIYVNCVETMLNYPDKQSILFQYSEKNYPHGVYYPIGFFLSKPENKIFKYLMVNAKKYYDPNKYQGIGVQMFEILFVSPVIEKYILENKGGITPIENSISIFNDYFIELFGKNEVQICHANLYCPFKWNELEKMVNSNKYDFTHSYIGIHWYNGSAFMKNFCINLDKNLTTFKFTSEFTRTIGTYIKENRYEILMQSKFALQNQINKIDVSIKEHEYYQYVCINKLGYINISIVMTSSDRSRQTYFTLKMIDEQSKDKDVQVILIDDSDDDKIKLDSLKIYKNIQIDFISIRNKNWVNPCVNYNIGFKFVLGEIVVIQNAEVCYVGDMINFIKNNINANSISYYVFDVKQLVSFDKNEYLYNNYELLKNVEIYDNNELFELNNIDMWYQNATLRNYGMHFCSCMNIKTLNKIGGFSYDCCYGTDYDDNDLLLRIISQNIPFIPISNKTFKVGGIHLYHEKTKLTIEKNIRNNSIYLFKLKMYNEHKIYIDFTSIEIYKKYLKIYNNDDIYNYDFEVIQTKLFYNNLNVSQLHNKIKLSILVPTVPSRLNYFYTKIMNELMKQIKNRNDIEVISLFDNKKRTIGTKRQEMLELSKGEYVTFIDDDDRISEDYIKKIINGLYDNPNVDCLVYNVICCVDNSSIKKLCKYGIEFEYGDISETEWRGKPSHTMVWKREIAIRHKYKNMMNGEDCEWVKRAYKDIKTQIRIDDVLYYYDAQYSTTSETALLSDDVIQKNMSKLVLN
jgi:glycosyltransferase involved in cell wall biosynthesis